MSIRLLPAVTADRIAAGEVVERPAAAVKELVENALDAGATRIAVTIEGGGIDRLLVEDDGCGMGPEDLALCVERHATSKLPEEDTLFRIATLGFRGEALPSIGAVARLSITSRPAEGPAHAIAVEAGRKGEVTPASGAPGTRVEVRDLFFATPARRKFLRQPRTEAEHAAEAVRRLAMAWPGTGFRVEAEGRVVLDRAADAYRASRRGAGRGAGLPPRPRGGHHGRGIRRRRTAGRRRLGRPAGGRADRPRQPVPRHGGGAAPGGQPPAGARPGAEGGTARGLS